MRPFAGHYSGPSHRDIFEHVHHAQHAPVPLLHGLAFVDRPVHQEPEVFREAHGYQSPFVVVGVPNLYLDLFSIGHVPHVDAVVALVAEYNFFRCNGASQHMHLVQEACVDWAGDGGWDHCPDGFGHCAEACLGAKGHVANRTIEGLELDFTGDALSFWHVSVGMRAKQVFIENKN